MKNLLILLILLGSVMLSAQTQTDKLVQNAANLIKSDQYREALNVLSEADQTDYRVSYMQIISQYSILQNVQRETNSQASKYISKFGGKNLAYTKTVSKILEELNQVPKIESELQEYAESSTVSSPKTELFPPIKYGSGTADFVWLDKKTKKLFSAPDYSLIKNPKEISEFLQRYEIKNGTSFFQGVINFCHFYEIHTENADGSGTRKMLDLRNGQIYDVPGSKKRCTEAQLQEFANNSNIYMIDTCEDSTLKMNVYSWDESSKNFNLVRTISN